jgi:hypothetical protein
VILKDPQILILRFRNTGKKCISADDFKDGKPITVTYDQNPPLNVKVVRASRGVDIHSIADISLNTGELKDDGDVRIVPRLLNEAEWFDVQLLSDQPHGLVAASARFADQKRPMRRIDLSQQSRRDFWLAGIGLIIGMLAGGIAGLYIAKSSFLGSMIFGIITSTILTWTLWGLTKYVFPKIRL